MSSNSSWPLIKSFWLGKSAHLSVENYVNFWQSCLGDHAKSMILVDNERIIENHHLRDYKELFGENGFLTQNAIGNLSEGKLKKNLKFINQFMSHNTKFFF